MSIFHLDCVPPKRSVARFGSVFSMALLTICFTLCSVLPLPAQNVPKNFIPASSIAVIEVQPKSALAQPSMDLIPREIIKVFGEKELGVNLLELKRVTLVVDEVTDPSMRQPPGLGVMIEFDSPQTLSDKVFEELKPTTLGEHKAWLLGGEGEVLVVLDQQHLMLGLAPFLQKMLDAGDADNPLVQHLEKIPAEDHFKAVVLIEPMRDLIKQNLPPKHRVPPPFGEFMALPDLVRSVTIRQDVSPDEICELTIESNDSKDAERIVRLINNAVEWGKGAALTGIAREMDISDPDYEKAIVDYADRLSEWLKTELRPEVEDNLLVYNLGAEGFGGSSSTVATIGILTGMLLPAVQQVREAARRSQTQNHLKQCALAAHFYHDAHNQFPQAANYDDEGKPLLSWRVHLLPYLEHGHLYEQFKLDEPWDSPHNIQLLDRMPDVFRNPNVDEENKTVYLAVSGEGTVFPGNQKIGFRDIIDGTSNTAMFVEADSELAVEWTKPQDWTMDPIDPLRGLGNLRPGGFNVAICDGSVHFISIAIDPQTWKNIVLRADGNVVDF